jgi:hypothetical protein
MSLMPSGFVHRVKLALLVLATLVAGCAGTAVAQPETPPPGYDDPPARVGRVSAIEGRASMAESYGAPWNEAAPNQIVTNDTSLWVPPGARVELRLGSTSVRMDGNTQAVFAELDDQGVYIDVPQGTLRARVRSLAPGDHFTLAADGVRAEVTTPGDYRITYDPEQRHQRVAVFTGRLRIVTPANTFNVEPGQEAEVESGGASMSVRSVASRGDFDFWAERRDLEQDRLASIRYVSPEMTGVESLDDNGRWMMDASYGPVWYPYAVPAGWAPYRYGSWTYVRPWGWCWVDSAPWGFAPFHYGRWALIGGTWGWVPGPMVAKPVWAPALVGYAGGGHVSGSPVGWFPLAPAEAYVPPYRHSPRYVNYVNVNIYNRNPATPGQYRYAQNPGALTVVSQDTFRNAAPVHRDRIVLTPGQISQIRPVTPTPGAGMAGMLPAPQARYTPRNDDPTRRSLPAPRTDNASPPPPGAPSPVRPTPGDPGRDPVRPTRRFDPPAQAQPAPGAQQPQAQPPANWRRWEPPAGAQRAEGLQQPQVVRPHPQQPQQAFPDPIPGNQVSQPPRIVPPQRPQIAPPQRPQIQPQPQQQTQGMAPGAPAQPGQSGRDDGPGPGRGARFER